MRVQVQGAAGHGQQGNVRRNVWALLFSKELDLALGVEELGGAFKLAGVKPPGRHRALSILLTRACGQGAEGEQQTRRC